MTKKGKRTQTGKIEDAVMDNVNDIGQAIEVVKRIDDARKDFPLEVFDSRNEEEDYQMALKYSLAPWLQEYFGISIFPVEVKVSYKNSNPSRRDNH
jgi:CRISPR/Cas system-associated exonuclease Cas4 (RecB family)